MSKVLRCRPRPFLRRKHPARRRWQLPSRAPSPQSRHLPGSTLFRPASLLHASLRSENIPWPLHPLHSQWLLAPARTAPSNWSWTLTASLGWNHLNSPPRTLRASPFDTPRTPPIAYKLTRLSAHDN